MSTSRYRPLALLLLVLHLGGCMTWRPIAVSPRQVIEEEQPSSVRVTQPDGILIVLHDPAIRNDSIVGTDEEGVVRQMGLDDGAIAVRRVSGVKSVLLGIAIAPVLFIAVFLAACSGGGCDLGTDARPPSGG